MSDAEVQALQAQVAELATSMKKMDGKVTQIHQAFVGTIGPPEITGLLERVRTLENMEARRMRLEWAGLLALLGLVLNAVWELIAS